MSRSVLTEARRWTPGPSWLREMVLVHWGSDAVVVLYFCQAWYGTGRQRGGCSPDELAVLINKT